MPARPVKPLVAIVGATGTGKSDLAVEIARRFNGEIINGDAMQLYKGLPIITNQITQDETKGVPHHLLGCIGLDEETWTVGKFVHNALGVIDEIRSRGKLPILVGGTHYYTQSLLFKHALSEEPLAPLNDSAAQQYPILDQPTEAILEKLKEVDPVMADRWHPNERRKIQRSLEIFLKTGKPASQIYEEQRQKRQLSPSSDGPATEGRNNDAGLRFPTLLLWVHAAKDALYHRLDSRVQKMLENGLLDEVQRLSKFRRTHEVRTGTNIDQSRGIWVSIGYKEFLEYQAALAKGLTAEAELRKLKSAAIEKTQASTRQYAKRQVRWIQIKLLNALISAGERGSIFVFDGTDLSRWNSDVIQLATDITEKFLSGSSLPDAMKISEVAREMLTPRRDYDLARRPDLWQKRTCQACGTVSVNENDWSLHVKSRAHRRAVGQNKKRENARSTPKSVKAPHQDIVDVFATYKEQLSDGDLK